MYLYYLVLVLMEAEYSTLSTLRTTLFNGRSVFMQIERALYSASIVDGAISGINLDFQSTGQPTTKITNHKSHARFDTCWVHFIFIGPQTGKV